MTETLRHTLAIAARHLVNLLRQPWFIGISLAQPLIYLLIFGQLFERVGDLPGFPGAYVTFILPGIVVVTAFFNGGWAGTTTLDDMDRGTLDRLLVTPAHHGTLLAGALLQNAALVAAQSLVVLGLGVLVGAELAGGALGLVLMLVVAMTVGTGVGAMSHALALVTRRGETLIAAVQGVALPLTFLSSVFMVHDHMPAWIRAAARLNPLDWAAVAARESVAAAPDWTLVLVRLGWLATFAAFGCAAASLALRHYRRQA